MSETYPGTGPDRRPRRPIPESPKPQKMTNARTEWIALIVFVVVLVLGIVLS